MLFFFFTGLISVHNVSIIFALHGSCMKVLQKHGRFSFKLICGGFSNKPT